MSDAEEEYPFRVLIDDDNFIHGGSRNNSFVSETGVNLPAGFNFKRSVRRTLHSRQRHRPRRRNVSSKYLSRKTLESLNYTGSSCSYSDNEDSTECECSSCASKSVRSNCDSNDFSEDTLSISSSKKEYASHEMSDSYEDTQNSRFTDHFNQQKYLSDSTMDDVRGNSFNMGVSEASESDEDFSSHSNVRQHRNVNNKKKYRANLGHEIYAKAKPEISEIHDIIFNTVSKELEQLNQKGFSYPSGYDPSKQTLENNEITLFALRLQEQRVNNRNRIKGVIKIASLIFTFVCQWAKVEAIDTENFVSDISESVSAGEYDAFIDMIEPELQNNALTHPFTSMFIKFVDTAAESSEKRKREKRNEKTAQQAKATQMKNDQELQSVFQNMPKVNSTS